MSEGVVLLLCAGGCFLVWIATICWISECGGRMPESARACCIVTGGFSLIGMAVFGIPGFCKEWSVAMEGNEVLNVAVLASVSWFLLGLLACWMQVKTGFDPRDADGNNNGNMPFAVTLLLTPVTLPFFSVCFLNYGLNWLIAKKK